MRLLETYQVIDLIVLVFGRLKYRSCLLSRTRTSTALCARYTPPSLILDRDTCSVQRLNGPGSFPAVLSDLSEPNPEQAFAGNGN